MRRPTNRVRNPRLNMICPWCLSTAVLEFVNGMWNAVDRGAPKFLAEGDEEYSSSGCQYLLDTVRKVGREMSRLDDLVRVEVPSINGIPASSMALETVTISSTVI